MSSSDVIVLVVDGDVELRKSIVLGLELEDFNVLLTDSAAQTIFFVKRERIHFVLRILACLGEESRPFRRY